MKVGIGSTTSSFLLNRRGPFLSRNAHRQRHPGAFSWHVSDPNPLKSAHGSPGVREYPASSARGADPFGSLGVEDSPRVLLTFLHRRWRFFPDRTRTAGDLPKISDRCLHGSPPGRRPWWCGCGVGCSCPINSNPFNRARRLGGVFFVVTS